jgi:redox-sensitive bicupin YhaK (pirin superfamily)
MRFTRGIFEPRVRGIEREEGTAMTERHIHEARPAQPSMDGAGVAIQRVAGMQHPGMDPVLMIDELRSEHREDFEAGFPAHPHRGMQTLTYMKHGGIIHEDSQGNRGEIRSGGAQYMSAGRGIIHSEMPTQDTLGLHGFQLWFNLPASEKMSAPRYRDVPVGELTHVSGEGFEAHVISGSWQLGGAAIAGPLEELAPQAAMLDLELAPGASVAVAAESGENLIAYVYDGALQQGPQQLPAQHLALTSDGGSWTIHASEAGAGLLVLRGRPLREPVAHYGPFVMNTAQEIEQAIRDYQSGKLVA